MSSTDHKMRANYEYILNLPVVKKLNKKVSKLRNEIKILRRVILHLGTKLDGGEEKHQVNHIKYVYIKDEPGLISESNIQSPLTMEDLTTDSDDEANIRYDIEEAVDDDDENGKPLCKNQHCALVKDNKYTEKCSICNGYFADDGSNDIYLLNENGRAGSCSLCKKTQNVCIMKGTGQYVCVSACDEEEEEEEEAEEEEEEEEEEEAEEEEEEAEEEEEEAEEAEEEETEEIEEEVEEEVYEVTIKGVKYFTADAKCGEIYEMDSDGNPGDVVGRYVEGRPKFG